MSCSPTPNGLSDHYPYYMAIIGGIPHFQTYPSIHLWPRMGKKGTELDSLDSSRSRVSQDGNPMILPMMLLRGHIFVTMSSGNPTENAKTLAWRRENHHLQICSMGKSAHHQHLKIQKSALKLLIRTSTNPMGVIGNSWEKERDYPLVNIHSKSDIDSMAQCPVEIVDLPIDSMVIFHNYVSLPEGIIYTYNLT